MYMYHGTYVHVNVVYVMVHVYMYACLQALTVACMYQVWKVQDGIRLTRKHALLVMIISLSLVPTNPSINTVQTWPLYVALATLHARFACSSTKYFHVCIDSLLPPSLPPSLPQPYHLSLEADSADELTSECIMTKIQETRSVWVGWGSQT